MADTPKTLVQRYRSLCNIELGRRQELPPCFYDGSHRHLIRPDSLLPPIDLTPGPLPIETRLICILGRDFDKRSWTEITMPGFSGSWVCFDLDTFENYFKPWAHECYPFSDDARELERLFAEIDARTGGLAPSMAQARATGRAYDGERELDPLYRYAHGFKGKHDPRPISLGTVLRRLDMPIPLAASGWLAPWE